MWKEGEHLAKCILLVYVYVCNGAKGLKSNGQKIDMAVKLCQTKKLTTEAVIMDVIFLSVTVTFSLLKNEIDPIF